MLIKQLFNCCKDIASKLYLALLLSHRQLCCVSGQEFGHFVAVSSQTCGRSKQSDKAIDRSGKYGVFCYFIIQSCSTAARHEKHCWPNIIVMSTITHIYYCTSSHVLFPVYMASSKVRRYTILKIDVCPNLLCFTLWTATTLETRMPPRSPPLLLLQRLFALPRGKA